MAGSSTGVISDLIESMPRRISACIAARESSPNARTPGIEETNSSLAGHEFEPSVAEDPSCTKDQCSLNLSRFKRLPVGVVGKLGQLAASSGVVPIT
ncbi:hypothetical protein TNCV_2564921 [Trichonephila clavipes]|nr:hypothetical protein TNCV_2564921 [Trichonephila clavipes]